MGIIPTLLFLLIVGLIGYFIWATSRPTSDEVVLIPESEPGSSKKTIPYGVPVSFNQPEGITFSYSMWILVKDFTSGYGEKRTIFSRGDCPKLEIDSTSNSFIVSVKTYTTTETILIPNIPAMKWMHVAIVVNQQAVDVYINGTLRQHHSLSQLPDQPESEVTLGGDWNGVIGRMIYYPRSLTYAQVRAQSMEQPPSDLIPKVGKPNYFDITWYTGRLNSV